VLARTNPARAEELFETAAAAAHRRYARLERLRDLCNGV